MKRRIKILIFVLIVVIISSGTIGTLFFFTVIQNASPSARYGSAMVYDPVLQKAIFFGGGCQDADGYELFNDMWLYDPTSNVWTEINPTVKQSARSSHSMVYDSINHKTILFGGWDDTIGLMNDTWIYDSPASSPDTRYWHGMVYDSNYHKVIVFGGRNAGAPGQALEDTWVFDPSNNEWTELLPSSHPSNRMDSSVIYDSNHQKTILFGGFRFSGNTLGDT